jgi:hypothetical protein
LQQKLGKTISQDDWIIVYSIPFDTLLNTKLQEFQYKINLRCLYANERLIKCKLSETEMFTFCFETMTHLFYYCTHVRLLWPQFAQCLNT